MTTFMGILRLVWAEAMDSCRRQCGLLLCCWLVLAGGQPFLAVALRNLTAAALRDDLSAVAWNAGFATVALAVIAQALYQSYLLRIEIHDRVGLRLATRVFQATAENTGIGHLEDAKALNRIRLAIDGWSLVGALAGGVQLLAVTAGLILTLPVVGSASAWSLLMIPLSLPLIVASVISFRSSVAAGEKAIAEERVADNLLHVVFDPGSGCELRVTDATPILLDEYQRHQFTAARIRNAGMLRGAVALAVAWTLFVGGFVFVLFKAVNDTTGAAQIVPIIAIGLQLQGIAVAMVNGSAGMVHGRQVANAERQVFEDLVVEARSQHAPVPERIHSGLSLRDVSFRYPQADREAVSKITIDLPAGSLVALLGVHGSGKSTLVKLLTRMYEPTSGEILLDGRPLSTFDVQGWRSRTAVCFQDFVRLPVTVREVVGIGNLPVLEAGDDRPILTAMERGGGLAVLERLPTGLETSLAGAGAGTQLSGGQWQRLALSRASMRDDALLVVLDEPTAAMDPLAEREMFDRQAELARELAALHGTITLAITHRFATVQHADLILVIEEGSLMEYGSHIQLLRSGGRYAELYTQQQEAYR